jgi:hypothetical protein
VFSSVGKVKMVSFDLLPGKTEENIEEDYANVRSLR